MVRNYFLIIVMFVLFILLVKNIKNLISINKRSAEEVVLYTPKSTYFYVENGIKVVDNQGNIRIITVAKLHMPITLSLLVQQDFTPQSTPFINNCYNQ